jgi:hypothetical protein
VAMRVIGLLAITALILSGGGIASAAPRYSDWGNRTKFDAVNTAALEFPNAISKDGLTFYFQRGLAAAGGEDIWISQRDSEDAPWGTPTKLPETINTTAYNERAAAESPDGHWLFFASNRPGIGDFDIYVSWRQHTRDANGWETPVRLDTLNTTGFDSGPTVFENEVTGVLEMYLTSNPAGPQNNSVDIYRSSQIAGTEWNAPEKVGALSSPLVEGRPTVRHDGLEIFWNSARTDGLGGPGDVWTATRGSVTEEWSSVQLAAGVNTSRFAENIPALSWDGRTLFFSSNRDGAQGEIYFMTRDKVTGKP